MTVPTAKRIDSFAHRHPLTATYQFGLGESTVGEGPLRPHDGDGFRDPPSAEPAGDQAQLVESNAGTPKRLARRGGRDRISTC